MSVWSVTCYIYSMIEAVRRVMPKAELEITIRDDILSFLFCSHLTS